MNQRERLEAQLELLTLEEAFRDKKAAGELSMQDKLDLREARRVYREETRAPAENGVQPEAVGVDADVEGVE